MRSPQLRPGLRAARVSSRPLARIHAACCAVSRRLPARALGVAALLTGAATPTLARALPPAAASAPFVVDLRRDLAPLGLTIAVMSDSLLTLDSKSATTGPNTAFVHFRVTNGSGTTYRGLLATAAIADPAVLQFAGNQSPAQYLPTLAPGASADLYWFVGYARTIGLATTVAVTVSDGGGNSDAAVTTVRTSGMNGSGTGGTLDAQTIGATHLGVVTAVEVTYVFAGINAGGAYNMQPAGTAGLDAGCFQLVGTEVLASDHPQNIPVGRRNQMYFVATTAYGGGSARVTMRFEFRVRCLGVTSTVKPYANETSGGTNRRYSSNFDAWTGGAGGTITFPPVSNPITVAKAATPDSLTDGGAVTYTVTLSNSQAGIAFVDSIVDVLPAGVIFDSLGSTSQVTAPNSGFVPAAGATGTLRFRSIPGTYYAVPPGGALQLVFHATVPTPEGSYTNTARGFVASVNAGTGSATTFVRRKADLAVVKTGPDTGHVLDTLAYVITTSNAGPSAADSVVVRDTLPASLTFLRASRGATASGRAVTFPPLARLPRDSALIDTVFVTASDTGAATNVAGAQSLALDPVAANNDGSAPASRSVTLLLPELLRVTVTPDGLPTPVRRTGGAYYAQDFLVTNGAKRPHLFDVQAGIAQPVVFLTRDSLRVLPDAFNAGGVATTGDSARVTLGNGVPTAVTLVYSVAQGDTAQGALHLRARAVADRAVADSGRAEVRRVRPLLTLQKSVTPSTDIVPGTELTYTVQFANDGEWDASDAVLVEQIPAALTLKVGSVVATLPGGIAATTSFSSDGGVTWTYTPATRGCSAPDGFDACVDRIRLTISGALPAGAAASTGTLTYVARVP